jgi:hypothetical protein
MVSTCQPSIQTTEIGKIDVTRDEADALLRARRTNSENKRPQSSEADSRPVKALIAEVEHGHFEEAMARAARLFERKHGHWPFPEWFKRHRARFVARLNRQLDTPRVDPPCKHWARGLEGSPLLPGMLRLWEANLHDFALRYPYLASPSAPCGCHGCNKVIELGRRMSR